MIDLTEIQPRGGEDFADQFTKGNSFGMRLALSLSLQIWWEEQSNALHNVEPF